MATSTFGQPPPKTQLKSFTAGNEESRSDRPFFSGFADHELPSASNAGARQKRNDRLRTIRQMPLGAIEDRRARGDSKAFRNTFASTPRKADYVWTTIARVLSVAKDHGKIGVNVCERGGRLYESDRSEIIWTADDIRAFCGVASIELQAALLLALWTGQRQGDLLRLTWSHYDGTYIRMRQSKGRGNKGRQRVTIPVGPPLKEALDAALKEKRSAVTILVNSFGRPWTEDGFRTSWDKAFKKTSLKDLHFHDLRGTAVTRLALSNCSVPEIAAITGHSMATVQQILDAHYLGGRVKTRGISDQEA